MFGVDICVVKVTRRLCCAQGHLLHLETLGACFGVLHLVFGKGVACVVPASLMAATVRMCMHNFRTRCLLQKQAF